MTPSRRKKLRVLGRLRLFCRVFGHNMESCDLGHGTGATIYYCTRCPHWWSLT